MRGVSCALNKSVKRNQNRNQNRNRNPDSGGRLGASAKAWLSDASLLLVAAIWGSGFVVVKSSLALLTPAWVVALRFCVAAATSLIFFGKKLTRLTARSLGAGAALGAVLYIAFMFQTLGAQRTTAGKNALLTSVYVVLVPFIFWIQSGKRPRKVSVAAAIVSFIGVGFLVLGDGFGRVNLGDLLTLVCGILFAVQISMTGIFVKKYDAVLLNSVQLLVCAVFGVCTALALDGVPASLPLRPALSMFYLGFFCTFAAYVAQSVAQKYTSPSHVSLILSLECAFGSIFSVLILGDPVTRNTLIGAILAIGAVFLGELADHLGARRKRAGTVGSA